MDPLAGNDFRDPGIMVDTDLHGEIGRPWGRVLQFLPDMNSRRVGILLQHIDMNWGQSGDGEHESAFPTFQIGQPLHKPSEVSFIQAQ